MKLFEVMRIRNIIVLMVGALFSVPTFLACGDDPVLEDIPVVPGDSGGDDEPEPMDYDSWFDLPAEERWGIRWMLGDDMTMRGPGEYEFNVGAEGEEFTFWFPDCDFFLRWADIDGISYYHFDDEEPFIKLCDLMVYMRLLPDYFQGIICRRADDNKMEMSVSPNVSLSARRYVLYITSNNGSGIVKLVFNQSPGNSGQGNINDGTVLYWKSEKEPILAMTEYWPGTDYKILQVYPSNEGASFALKCLNSQNLTISRYGDDVLVKQKEFEYETIKVKTRNDSVFFDLSPNDSEEIKYYRLLISDGQRSSYFSLIQRNDGFKWNDKVCPVLPELELVNDGSRWIGSITPNYAIRVPSRGGVMTIRPLNHDVIIAQTVYVDGNIYECENKYYISYSSIDIPFPIGMVHHHDGFEAIDCNFVMNMTGSERVIKINVMHDSYSNIAVVNDFFRSELISCGQIVFVQPPYQPGIDDE